MRRLGVEEELLLVDPDSGVPAAVASTLLGAHRPESTEESNEWLEREDFVASRWEMDSDRPGPRRRMYTLTDAGRIWARSKGLGSAPTTSGSRP
jgi:Transcriptional regulator PadR-like family